jgi:starch synthase
VSVVLPCYRGFATDRKLKPRSTGVKLGLQVGGKRVEAEILDAKAANGVQLFLVKQDEYFDRAGIYGEDGRDYEDNAERFIFFRRQWWSSPAGSRRRPISSMCTIGRPRLSRRW